MRLKKKYIGSLRFSLIDKPWMVIFVSFLRKTLIVESFHNFINRKLLYKYKTTCSRSQELQSRQVAQNLINVEYFCCHVETEGDAMCTPPKKKSPWDIASWCILSFKFKQYLKYAQFNISINSKWCNFGPKYNKFVFGI